MEANAMEFPSRANVDVRLMQRSSTVSTLSSGSAKIGSWFSALSDRRRNKKSMKASKSITLAVKLSGKNSKCQFRLSAFLCLPV
ncbi:unnamed protein product [Notodromas monacha]|uniref:Uncharacterized protein n=1 Tax=Notodromas monacha TaxID=399045 RepID=A0A7R9BE99_9CRUS|nr:unnamed protein product [Notodromas monacha]CAG0912646.1 unnamed protein product [Notodromas monacha]